MSNSTSQSKMISLVPTNGTEFSIESGKKVIFEVPANLSLIKGRDSYLTLDIVNTSSDFSRLMLETTAGADSIMSRVDIYSLQHGTHLETLNNYNQWVSISNQYLYEDKTNLQTLTGCGHQVYSQTDNKAGATQPVVGQANFVEDTVLSPITTAGVQVYNFRRYTTPLKAGIFRWWDDERLCPVLALGGLRIEITLESPKTCLHYISGVAQDLTKYEINPNSASGIVMDDNGSGAPLNTVSSTKVFNNVEESGFAIGNLITINHDLVSITDGVISGLAIAPSGKLNITFTGTAVPDGATGVRVVLRNDTRSAVVRPQLRVVSMSAPQDAISKMSGGFQYEFTSWDMLLSSLIASSLRHEAEINSVASRALCIITAFTNLDILEGAQTSGLFAGQTPAELNLNSVQYFMDNKLQPVRAYNPTKTVDKVVVMNEIVKSFASISYEALDLGNADGRNLEEYTNNFVIGRQLAKRGFYYNLRDAEPQIRLGFSGTRTSNVQVNNFVWSKKIVNVSADGNLEVLL